jgi:phosphoribosylanthranilate isomerase
MALKTLVKVGNVTNLSDARYSAGMGVEFLGFRVIEGQHGSVSAKSFQEIRGWITGPQIVAELYGIQGPESLPSIVEQFQPDYFELSLTEFMRVGGSLSLPFILSLESGEDLPASLVSKPAYVLTDVSESRYSKLIPEYEIMAIVKGVNELQYVIGQTGISAVALSGSAEIRPGLKTYDDLSEILEALEVD